MSKTKKGGHCGARRARGVPYATPECDIPALAGAAAKDRVHVKGSRGRASAFDPRGASIVSGG